MDASDLVDLGGYLRYGMPTSQKEAIAASGTLPGAPKDTSVDQGPANRYASGFLFQKAHPTLAPILQGAADLVHAYVPQMGSADPSAGDKEADLQSYATAGANAARLRGYMSDPTTSDAASALANR